MSVAAPANFNAEEADNLEDVTHIDLLGQFLVMGIANLLAD
jgi:hypothetical protein